MSDFPTLARELLLIVCGGNSDAPQPEAVQAQRRRDDQNQQGFGNSRLDPGTGDSSATDASPAPAADSSASDASAYAGVGDSSVGSAGESSPGQAASDGAQLTNDQVAGANDPQPGASDQHVGANDPPVGASDDSQPPTDATDWNATNEAAAAAAVNDPSQQPANDDQLQPIGDGSIDGSQTRSLGDGVVSDGSDATDASQHAPTDDATRSIGDGASDALVGDGASDALVGDGANAPLAADGANDAQPPAGPSADDLVSEGHVPVEESPFDADGSTDAQHQPAIDAPTGDGANDPPVADGAIESQAVDAQAVDAQAVDAQAVDAQAVDAQAGDAQAGDAQHLAGAPLDSAAEPVADGRVPVQESPFDENEPADDGGQATNADQNAAPVDGAATDGDQTVAPVDPNVAALDGATRGITADAGAEANPDAAADANAVNPVDANAVPEVVADAGGVTGDANPVADPNPAADANPVAVANPADANPAVDANPVADANTGDGGAAPGNAPADSTITNGTLPNPDQPRMSVEEILARNADQPTISDSDPSFWERINNGEVPGVVPAFAPAAHYDMTRDASERAGFTPDVAASIAAASRNIDYQHFDQPHMHANADQHETPEQAAENNINLMTENGSNLRLALDRYQADPSPGNGQQVVDVLGRINHQMQDAYAHEGMSFGQHAHMDREHNSPDHDPTALAAGAAMTQHLMATVANDLRERGINPADFQARSRWRQQIPSPSQIGPMLQYRFGTHEYDGTDTRWNSGVNRQIFDGFVRGLRTR